MALGKQAKVLTKQQQNAVNNNPAAAATAELEKRIEALEDKDFE